MISYLSYIPPSIRRENTSHILDYENINIEEDFGKFPKGNAKKMEWLSRCQIYYETIQHIKKLTVTLEYTYETSLLNPDVQHRKTLKQEAQRLLQQAYNDLDSLGPKLIHIKNKIEMEKKLSPGSTFVQALEIQYNRCTRALEKTMFELQSQQMKGKTEQRKVIREKALLIKNDLTSVELDDIMDTDDPQTIVQEMETKQLETIMEIRKRAKERNKTVRKIEKEMIQLYQLYTSFNLLVMTQKDKMEEVGAFVNNTKKYADKAERKMERAERNQRNAKKICCSATVITAIVIAIIVGVLVMNSQGGN